MKKDFDCELTEFEDDLPTDDSGVDVPLVLERMRRAIRDIPGFEVIEDAAIAPFSFAKYLMWKDLVDRVGQLEHNRVVRHLIHEPDKAFAPIGLGPMPQPRDIDSRYVPGDLFHPLPADSSQLAAIMAASEGHDLVIVGPPGTGKSQTIANLIAQCLAVGKTVLFVAEKTAALDVVHRRLREHGLGVCCVELHSNKAERRRFLDQLEASWLNRTKENASDWTTINNQLQLRRDQLNAYAEAVHVSEKNGWTPYRAMGVCVRGKLVDTPCIDWSSTLRHDHKEYIDIQDVIAKAAAIYVEVSTTDASMSRVQATEWSMAWENELLKSCDQLESASKSLAEAIEVFSQLIGASWLVDVSAVQLPELYRLAQELARLELPMAELLLHSNFEELKHTLDERSSLLQQSSMANESLEAAIIKLRDAIGAPPTDVVSEEIKRPLYRLANELVRKDTPPASLVFHEQFDVLVQGLNDRHKLLQDRGKAREALEARSFNSVLIDRVPVEKLERIWKKASSSIWPFSAWRKRRVCKKIKAFMTTEGMAEPEVDMLLLYEYRTASERLAENLTSLDLPHTLLAMVDEAPDALDSQISSAQRMREIIVATGLSPSSVGKASQGSLESLAAVASGLYPPGREVRIFA